MNRYINRIFVLNFIGFGDLNNENIKACVYVVHKSKCEQSRVIVHFKRLGSRCFYDLFERCYFFFLNRYAYSKTKPLDIWG